MQARLAWGLATSALVLLLTALVVSLFGGSDVNVESRIFTSAITFVFAGVGVLIAVREPRNAIGWIFLGSAVAAGLGSLAGSYADYWVDGRPGSEALGEAAAWYGEVSWMPFILVPSTFLLLLFPDGRLLSPRWRPVAWCAGVGIAATFVLSGLEPGPIPDYPQVANPYGVDSPLLDPLMGLAVFALVVGLLGSALSLILRFRRARGAQREQIKWLAFAGAVAVVTVVIGAALYDVVGETAANVAIMLSVLALPAATGVAILHHGLYDINVVINRTLVYAALTAGLAAIYGAVSLALGVALGAGSTLPTAAATLAVAVAFRPLRARLQLVVDRCFDRARYEGLRRIQRFLEDLRAGRAAPEATGEVIAQAVGDPRLELFFWLPEAQLHVDAAGRAVDELPVAGRAVTPVHRGTLELASVMHDPALAEHPDLLESVLSAAGRSRSPGYGSRCAGSSLRSRPRGPESLPSAMRSAAASSATSTTAPSSGSSRSGWRCATYSASCHRGALRPRRSTRRSPSWPMPSKSYASWRAGSAQPVSTTGSLPPCASSPHARPCAPGSRPPMSAFRTAWRRRPTS